MALVFPVDPAVGDVHPADPGTSGVTQYRWDGTKWNAVLSTVSLGTTNQGAFNNYLWPGDDGVSGHQLTTDGEGNLTWGVPASPSLQVLSLLEPFNGEATVFTLVKVGTTSPFTPTPVENLVVFLGGVPQIPTSAYVAFENRISFTEPPLPGTTFYAISNVAAI